MDQRDVNSSCEAQQRKILRANRNMFSDHVYLSHRQRNRFSLNSSVSTLKSTSTKSLDETLNNGYKSVNTDSSTQTSKTILQLAELEAPISPDSLSPREENEDMDLDKEINFIQTNTGDGGNKHADKSISFARKISITQYMEDHDKMENARMPCPPGKTLKECFLEKNKGRHSQKSETDTLYLNPHLNSAASSTCETCTKLHQYIVPPQNLCMNRPGESLRSQSCVDSYHPNYVGECFQEMRQTPISRFTVKNVTHRHTKDNTKPVKYYCQARMKMSHEKKADDSNRSEETCPELCSAKRNGPKPRRHSGSFMSPTLSSERRNKLPEVHGLQGLISPTRRGRSVSPKRHSPVIDLGSNIGKIPYIDQNKSEVDSNISEHKTVVIRKNISWREGSCPRKPQHASVTPNRVFREDLLKLDQLNLQVTSSNETLSGSCHVTNSISVSSIDNIILMAINKVRDRDWNIALKGLAEIIESCHVMDPDLMFPHMTSVNQRLVELLRSPRSQVCRTACQATAHLFEYVKDTRRPEFDDIVDILLGKTADANKFIRQDANLSLDCMVTHIPTFHAVRSLCAKGPVHKNPLVRTATVRLIVCAVVIAGTDVLLNPNNSENTRKRVFVNMAKFLDDKNLDVRKYGERLYKVLCKESNFELYLKKYLESDYVVKIKKSFKFRNKR